MEENTKLRIKVLATGSAGNCYTITNKKGNILLLECGIEFTDMIKYGLDISRVIGAIYTHEHLDHSKGVDKVKLCGIEVCGHDCLISGKITTINDFDILPMAVNHLGTDCFSFIIRDRLSSSKILFCTDLVSLPKIKDTKFDAMLLECNFDNDTVCQRISTNTLKNANYKSHMGLETLEEWLKPRQIKPTNILLIHGSNSGNLDYAKALKTVTPYGEKVQIAVPQLEIKI